MIIILKNKDTLCIDDFRFKCVIGKNGTSKNKIEGDKKTPIGTFSLGPLYFRNDRNKKIDTNLKIIKIKIKLPIANLIILHFDKLHLYYIF